MKLAEFTSIDGVKVAINPEAVDAVRWYPPTFDRLGHAVDSGTRVYMRDGTDWMLGVDFDTVCRQLRMASA